MIPRAFLFDRLHSLTTRTGKRSRHHRDGGQQSHGFAKCNRGSGQPHVYSFMLAATSEIDCRGRRGRYLGTESQDGKGSDVLRCRIIP
jgi:hypothetical protein